MTRKQIASSAILTLCLLVLAVASCGKKEEESADEDVDGRALMAKSASAPGAMGRAAGDEAAMAYESTGSDDEGESAGKQTALGVADGVVAAPEPSRDAYYESNYEAGYGERQRVAELIGNGVVVDGKEIHLAAFSREYEQSFEIPTDKALSLSAETEHAKITESGGKTYLQVGLQAIKREAPARAALNIALVIDRSGSMGSEQKLEFARRAAEDVVNRLEASDRLAVVTYDDSARIDIPSTPMNDKESVLRTIRNLQPGNSTNIHGGLNAGYEQVRAHIGTDKVNTVILVSDGLVTAGPSSQDLFRDLVGGAFDEGMQTTTVGVGLDFEESLMSLIAREGKGNFHFVSDPASIQEIFDRELGDLTHVVAKAVNLRIVLDDSIRLVRVLGTNELDESETERVREDESQIDRQVYEDLGIVMDRQDDPDEPGIKMVIPHFYLGDSHVVLMEIKVPAGKRTAKVADIYLKYKDMVFRKNREQEATAKISRVPSKSDMVASTRQPVRKNRCGYETGEALLNASTLLAQGRPADAAKVVDERMATLGVAAREWGDTDIEKDHELLGRYQEVLIAMAQGNGDAELGRYLAKSLSYSGNELTR